MTFYKCSVIIPTKNALPLFREVLNAVCRQETSWPYEVIMIDCGSTDGTQECATSYPNVRLIEIDPKTFGHGRTRNQAIEAANSEFVALLTHDAKPFDEHWLANLVATAEQDVRIAGVFGRHVAYENQSPFTELELDEHFEGFLRHPLVVDRDTDPKRYQNDIGWLQFLHFYSDNNSLMRKSVWREHPYPDVEFAEDQLWAKLVIDKGYRKAYAPGAVVYHSHDYNPWERLRRAFDESRNFNKHFGYHIVPSFPAACSSIYRVILASFSCRIDPDRYGVVTPIDRCKRTVLSVSKIIGLYLGTNHERLPKPINNFLSLDYQLYKS
jgi:glycosyltransferase involved in cell wall biosynthesis